MASANQVIQNASTRVLFLAVDNRDVQPPDNTLLELVGASTASDTSGIQTVDISSFGDGFSVPKVKTALDGNYTVAGVVTDTPAHEAYRSLADGPNKEKEAFVMIVNGDGSTESAYGLITDYQTTRDQRDVLRFTSTVNVQSGRTTSAPQVGPALSSIPAQSQSVSDTPFSYQAVNNGESATSWSITGAPDDWAISNSGLITGPLTVAGSSPAVVVRATDAQGNFDEVSFVLNIAYATPVIDAIDTNFPINVISGQLRLDKVRADFEELLVHVPLDSAGREYVAYHMSNRFGSNSAGEIGEPFIGPALRATVGNTQATLSPRPENSASPYTQASTPENNLDTTQGTFVGTGWTGSLADYRQNTTQGDYVEFTFTVGQNGTRLIQFQNQNGAADAVLDFQITPSNGGSVEEWYIPDSGGSRLYSQDRNDGPLTENGNYFIPIAKLAAGTYTLRTTHDASSPASSTARIGRIMTIASPALGDDGIIGTGLDRLFQSFDYTILSLPGSVTVYPVAQSIKVDWVAYGRAADGAQALVSLYDDTGTLLNSVTEDLSDGNGRRIVNIYDQAMTTAGYLTVEVLPIPTDVNGVPHYICWDGGLELETQVQDVIANGNIDYHGLDPFSISSGSAYGTSVYAGTGNVHSFPSIFRTTETPADGDFVSGVHEYSNLTSIIYRVDGSVVDYASGAVGDHWEGDEIEVEMVCDLFFPNAPALEKWATYTNTLTFTKAGIRSTVNYVTVTDALSDIIYSIANMSPNTDPTFTFADNVGGGVEDIWLEPTQALTVNDYANAPITNDYDAPRHSTGIVFHNGTFAQYSELLNQADINATFDGIGGADPTLGKIRVVLRTDGFTKAYYQAFDPDTVNGTLIPTGTNITFEQNHRLVLGDISSIIAAQ